MIELIKEFNSLGGSTIKEHKQRFSLYTKKLESLDASARLQVLNNLKAVHRQEEIFLTKLYLRYDLKNNLRDIVLSGDIILCKIIIGYKPFVFKDYGINFFLEELFPQVSYIIRRKCIHKLALSIDNHSVAKAFFNGILEQFGIKTATPLLIACDEDFIRSIIKDYRIVLKERYLIKLYERFGKDLIDYHYEECRAYGLPEPFAKHPCFAQYVATHDIHSFHHLLKYGIPKLGRRNLAKFLRFYKEDIIKKPASYENLTNKGNAVIYKHLTREEYKEYFLNTFSSKPKELLLNFVNDRIKLLPTSERGSLFFETFRRKYGFDVYNYFEKDTLYFDNTLRILSSEDRLKFTLKEDDILEYQAPDYAFPLIKEKINFTSDMHARASLVIKLFKSATYNKDEVALQDALKYFLERHKNDKSSVREDVFYFLRDHNDLQKLNAETWKYIDELIRTEEALGVNEYTTTTMFEAQMKHQFTNNIEPHAEMRKFVKCIKPYVYSISTTDKALEKWYLLNLPAVCTEIITDKQEIKRYPHYYIMLLQTWNEQNPNEFISYYKFPEMVERCLEYHDGYYEDHNLMKCTLSYEPKDPIEIQKRNELLEKYLDKFKMCPKLWLWLLKNYPDIVEKKSELIFHEDAQQSNRFFYELHKMHYASLREKVRGLAMDVLSNSESKLQSMNRALTMLSFEKDFLNIIKDDKYYPAADAKLDVFDDNARTTLQLHQHVVVCLKNQLHANTIFSPLLRFCFKDYLQCTLGTLTFAMFHCPAALVDKYLQILEKRSVTVRKHALFFRTTIGSIQESCEALEIAGSNETNISLHKFIIARSFMAFCNATNQRTFDLLINHFKFIYERDAETHEMLLKFNLISKTYIGRYIAAVWTHLARNLAASKVLAAIKEREIPYLPDALCDDIIQHTLLNSQKTIGDENVVFIYKYLINNRDKLHYRFDIVMNNISALANDNSKILFRDKAIKAKNISLLYSQLCKQILTDKETAIEVRNEILDKFIGELPNVVLPFNRFEYQHLFEMCKCYLENTETLPHFIIKSQLEAIKKYGSHILGYYNECLAEQLNLISLDFEFTLNLIEKLLEYEQSESVKLLAIKLLPIKFPRNEYHVTKFNDVINKLMNTTSPVIEIYLNKKINVLKL